MKRKILLMLLTLVALMSVVGCSGRSLLTKVRYNDKVYYIPDEAYDFSKKVNEIRLKAFNQRRDFTDAERQEILVLTAKFEQSSSSRKWDRIEKYYERNPDKMNGLYSFMSLDDDYSYEFTNFLSIFDYYERGIYAYETEYGIESSEDIVDYFMANEVPIYRRTLPQVVDYCEQVYGLRFKL